MELPEHSWSQWQAELSHRLGLQSDWLTNRAALRRPWFLIPHDNELNAPQAKDLVKAVRQRLLGIAANPRTLDVVHNIRELTPAESLPLLFVMRHIARHEASLGRYWPACHEALFAPEITLDSLRMRLAPELTLAWLRMYEATLCALYFPSEGRRNIKWPIAHAGFLPEDEHLLTQFGQALAQAYEHDRRSAPLDLERLDEFIDALIDWLERRAYHGIQSNLYSNLTTTTDGASLTIGEVAQYWLGQHWDELGVEEESEWKFRLPRRNLKFDPVHNRVQFELASSSWPGRVLGKLRWEEREYPLPAQFADSDEATTLSTYTLPLSGPPWPKQVHLQINDVIYHLSVPRLAGDASLIFKSTNGKSVRSLRLAEDYIILIADNRLETARVQITEIIEDAWYVLGRPAGNWAGYTLLAVRVRRDLFDRHWLDSDRELASRIDQIESATEALGLPSFGHLWRPQVQLMGGTVRRNQDDEPVYALDDPPCLEILGFWDDLLPLSVRQWHESAQEYFRFYSCTVPRTSTLTPLTVEIWEPGHVPLEGRYAVYVGETQQFTFRLESAKSSALQMPRATLALRVWQFDQQLASDALTTAMLDHCDLQITGWPFAALTVSISSGAIPRSLSISLDEKGEKRFHWKDLGLDVPHDGKATVRISWRDALFAEVVFVDRPYVLPDECKVVWSDSPGALAIQSNIHRQGHTTQAELIVLGPRPWQGQCWKKNTEIDSGGQITTTIGADPRQARWILFGAGSSTITPAYALWGAIEIPQVADSTIERWSDLTSGNWDQIAFLAEMSQSSVMLPSALIDTLHMIQIGLRLRDLKPLVANWATRWHVINTLDQLTMYRRWHALGLQPTPVVLGKLPTEFGRSNPPMPSTYITCAERRLGLNALLSLESQGHMQGRQPVSGQITSQSNQEALSFSLRTGEALTLCHKCGLVLPSRLNLEHTSSVEPGVHCSRLSAHEEGWRTGEERPVYLAVQLSSAVVLQGLLGFVNQIMLGDDGENVPATEEPWLDRLSTAYGRQRERTNTPHRWLYELRSLIEGLARWIERDTMEREQVINLGRLLNAYHDTLVILHDWMLDLTR